MPTSPLSVTLQPTQRVDGRSRERCPDAVFRLGDSVVATIRVDVDHPAIDLPDASVEAIDANDVLEVVIDEEAWLAEFARLLRPGGSLEFTLPASGILAWLNAANIHRYMVETMGRGDAPDLTRPTGWHRHYPPGEVIRLLQNASFSTISIHRAGLGLTEVPQLLGLVGGNFILKRRGTERALRPLRETMRRFERQFAIPGAGTLLRVSAIRGDGEPDDPSHHAENVPAKDIDHE